MLTTQRTQTKCLLHQLIVVALSNWIGGTALPAASLLHASVHGKALEYVKHALVTPVNCSVVIVVLFFCFFFGFPRPAMSSTVREYHKR